MKKIFFVLAALIILCIPHRDGIADTELAGDNDSTITLSEVMFAPQTGNNEFIELFNTSYTDSVDLKNFGLKYYTSAADLIISAGNGTILPPRTFVVVVEGDYDIENGIYKNTIPANALIVKISDNAFGSSGMANATSRTIQLFNPSGKKLEEYTYSADNSNGISDEKIFLTSDNSQANWANTKTINGTPGYRNSVTPADYDLSILKFKAEKDYELLGAEAHFEIVIKNYGVKASKDFLLKIFLDTDKDSTADDPELLNSSQGFSLQPGDSVITQFSTANFSAGKNLFIARLETAEDENAANNIAFYQLAGIQTNEVRNDIVINEIMYAPNSPQPEWIEIYNNSIKEINLKGYKVADDSDTLTVIKNSFLLLPNKFFVIASDSTLGKFFDITSAAAYGSLPTLNNTGDKILLLDSLNRVIDSLEYSSSWGGSSGKSLERISAGQLSTDPANWATSKDILSATPGRINSVSQKDYDLQVKDIRLSPVNPLIGDDVSLSALVKNIGKNPLTFELFLFEDTNNDSIPDLQLELLQGNTLAINDSGFFNFNHKIKNISGSHTLFIKAISVLDQDTTNNTAAIIVTPGYKKQSLVINEVMYNPAENEPEWIELFNNSSVNINLKNWSMTDIIPSNKNSLLTGSNLFIQPGEYLIVTPDSSFLIFHPSIKSNVLISKFGALNNSFDGIMLNDLKNNVIDSLVYSSTWGRRKGFSLERISPSLDSNDPANWGTSKDYSGSTAAKINSISQKDFDLKVCDIIFNPAAPLHGDDVTISASIKNTGKNSTSFSVYLFEDTNNDSLPEFKLDSLADKSLLPADSSAFVFNYKIPGISNSHTYIVKAINDSDQDSTNNFMIKTISAGYHKDDIVINEIMYDPEKDQPEWIELYNNSQKEINLKNWTLTNLSPGQQKFLFDNTNHKIDAGNFLVLASDSSFLNYYPQAGSRSLIINFGTLNNSGDGIAIYDFAGTLIDSLYYSSGWGGRKGFSLERISYSKSSNDSSNWRTSLTKSTPAALNSVLNILPYKKNSVVINEIMFNPSPQNSEFLEFYNMTDSSINIGGWKIADQSGSEIELSPVVRSFEQGSYFVLAADSSILKNYNLIDDSKINIANISSLGLSNNQDLIILKDAAGSTIDSIQYFESWHNKNFLITQNKSLERINPSLGGNYANNWSTSTDAKGATPGLQNSIYTKSVHSNSSITVSPNPFSPDNDGFEDFTIIHYSLTQKISQVRIKIFDSKGRLVRTLENNLASGSEGSIIFDGLDDNKNRLRIGIYIALVEAVNEQTGVTENLKAAIVVAKKF